MRTALDVRTLARSYGPEATNRLAKLMRHSKSDTVALSACCAILDRGFGKPVQAVQVQATRDLSRLTDAELEQLLATSSTIIGPATAGGGKEARSTRIWGLPAPVVRFRRGPRTRCLRRLRPARTPAQSRSPPAPARRPRRSALVAASPRYPIPPPHLLP